MRNNFSRAQALSDSSNSLKKSSSSGRVEKLKQFPFKTPMALAMSGGSTFKKPVNKTESVSKLRSNSAPSQIPNQKMTHQPFLDFVCEGEEEEYPEREFLRDINASMMGNFKGTVSDFDIMDIPSDFDIEEEDFNEPSLVTDESPVENSEEDDDANYPEIEHLPPSTYHDMEDTYCSKLKLIQIL